MRTRHRAVVFALLLGVTIAFPLGVIASHQFSDVPDANPYHADIDALVDSGVTTGCGGGKYCPGAFVTREQMAAFMNRLGALQAGKTPVVNAATAETADTAGDSDTLDGLDSTDLLDGFGFGELYTSDLVGGSGGSAYNLSCPEGSVATGLQGKLAAFFDPAIGHVQVECTPLSVGSFAFVFGEPTLTSASGSYGDDPYSIQCADNAVMTGIIGETRIFVGPVVAQLSIECTPVGGVVPADTETVAGTPDTDGAPFSLSCPPGQVVVGVGPASNGQLLDSIRIRCM
jgi:hypothetical protein